ncbi:MAG: class I SAM-dependent methyltransferase [Azospirillaceae bacterium]|nr:class I SAM-dependent methyltransferase [Azospirillaceae bacterium]
MTSIPCHVCRTGRLVHVDPYARLPRITSDVRVWPAGGQLAVCADCGAVQKPTTAAWRADCGSIYASYVVYRVNDGSEQTVFTAAGAGEARSQRLLRGARDTLALPTAGRLLDFGCGDGSLLRNARALLPGWQCAGAELSENRRAEIEAIAGAGAFHSGDPADLPGGFDLLTAVHVIEHLENPAATLATLGSKVGRGGHLIIQVPDVQQNPFDLLIVDHATHFTPASLRQVMAAAGLHVPTVGTDWFPREIAAVGIPGLEDDCTTGSPPEGADPAVSLAMVERHVDWLERLWGQMRTVDAAGPYGIFGTAIAATWAAADASDNLAFFVDEDIKRVGGTHLGRPILHPGALPAGARVMMAHTPEFTAKTAEHLAARAPEATIIHPPPW